MHKDLILGGGGVVVVIWYLLQLNAYELIQYLPSLHVKTYLFERKVPIIRNIH